MTRPIRHVSAIIISVIVIVTSPVAYRLALPEHMRIHDVFHVDLLSPYKETEQYGPAFSPPPPDLIDGEEEQEIESILDVRRKGRSRSLQYLIHWKGFPSSHDEWADRRHVHADELIQQFYTSRYKKGSPTSSNDITSPSTRIQSTYVF